MRVTTLTSALVLTAASGLWSAQSVVTPRSARQPLNIVLVIIDDTSGNQ